MAKVKLTREEADDLIVKMVDWALKAKDDNAPLDWRSIMAEARKLEDKVHKAEAEEFARLALAGKFRPDSPDRH